MPSHTPEEVEKRKKREAEAKAKAKVKAKQGRSILGTGMAGNAADALQAARKKRKDFLDSL